MAIETIIYVIRKGVESRGYRFVVPDDTRADVDAINDTATDELDEMKIEYDSIKIMAIDQVVKKLKELKDKKD